MQLKTLFTATLAASTASAATIESRDVSAVQQASSNIIDKLGKFTDAVKGLQEGGPPTQYIPLLSTTQDVSTALSNGTDQVNAGTMLNVLEAVQVVGPSMNLVKAANDSIQALIAAQSILESEGLVPMILKQLNSLRTSTENFGKTLVSKVPVAVSPIAQGIANQAVKAVSDGINVYNSADKCGPATGSSSESPLPPGVDPTAIPPPNPAPSSAMPPAEPTPEPSTTLATSAAAATPSGDAGASQAPAPSPSGDAEGMAGMNH
ncbi:hypothetical protein K402DRAFT_454637 [Aulographum hederae CBS 113979]|uniref:Cell wall protein n=1 Tax=Aulographum hederae CBS 113979 TaxID=1176131 RepID=A0A6G1GYZ5_9PEZI|nr:hypothetical protein K402DRAFT_454637 [Aulographum hederae CBS 113979]